MARATLNYPVAFEDEDEKSVGDIGRLAVISAPAFHIEVEAKSGQECHRFKLVTIGNWPEVKTEFRLKCVKIFGKKICTKVPVIYNRTCTKYAFVDVCYPTGELKEVQDCVVSAALAAAIAAVVTSGSAAGPTFKAALEACLLAKGAKWADQITVNAGWDSECGAWH
ncbi:hypothetical protein FJW06_15620 [Mesorhizobium sp. B4-1-3]|uniref:hypothetical protein n=1 Tax=Mesorhizobium sp. B4-1-3 TaxID=2589889 RepID=UPI0011299F67|nr:hypothetical protein [Mesorhizobium sp. B4-1-3]TPI13075.1 hypothetical protein FJW06_15620 [Mesorhizobium sp. B4-1-3]